MPAIPDRFEFEPDRDALSRWLYTRKAQIGSKKRPGFYSTLNYATDQFWFLIALIAEFIGVFVLIYSGFALGDNLFAAIAVVGAIALLLVDIFLAYKLHRNHGEKCFLKNQIVLMEDRKNEGLTLKRISSGKGMDFFYSFLIILIALIKLAGIVLLGTFNHIALYIFFAFMFFIIAYVHINHTGYWIYEWSTARAFKRQHGNWMTKGGSDLRNDARERRRPFSSPVLLNVDPDSKKLFSNLHHIKLLGERENGEETKEYQYELCTKGILIDEDIDVFLNGQNNEQRSLIVSECHRVQVEDIQGEFSK